MAGEFWLSDAQWAAIEGHLPRNQPGARRTDDRRVISGIVHMLKNGGRWQDCPACYGPPTTIYNRYHRWSRRGIWLAIFAALAAATPDGMQMIDSTTAKAHRSAAGGKGGPTARP
jgi:transposase